jgi:hypothetical protein
MRQMHLPCTEDTEGDIGALIARILRRRSRELPLNTKLSFALLAYLIAPEGEARRFAIAKTLSDHLQAIHDSLRAAASTSETITGSSTDGTKVILASVLASHYPQKEWFRTAELFQTVIDIAHAPESGILGGPGVQKAADLLERHDSTPGERTYRNTWAKFQNVAHLLAAAAHLLDRAVESTGERFEEELLLPILFAPESVLALGKTYEIGGLQLVKEHGDLEPILNPLPVWQIPWSGTSPLPPLVRRRLSRQDIQFLRQERRSRPSQ